MEPLVAGGLWPGLRFIGRSMQWTGRTGAVKDWKYSRNRSAFLIDSGEYFARICFNKGDGKPLSFDDQNIIEHPKKFCNFLLTSFFKRKL